MLVGDSQFPEPPGVIMNPEPRFTRSRNRWVAGVCGGIAEYFGWSALGVRVAYVILSMVSAGFPGILVYLVLWAVIPSESIPRRRFTVDPPSDDYPR
jgi:phage shock protein C